MTAFSVTPYSIDGLNEILAAKALLTSADMAARGFSVYFEEYFEALGAKTIVCENEYVDRHYPGDYAGYYASCFQPIDRYCRRLHFFSEEFVDDDLELLLRGFVSPITRESLNDNYLGFLVVKPLPGRG